MTTPLVCRLVGLLFLLSLFVPLRAQPEMLDGVTLQRDIPYAAPDGGDPLLLDLYLPSSTKPVPLVMWVHGGGWLNGDKNMADAVPLTTKLLKAGIAVASINYRFSNMAKFPAQLHDCKAAVRWLRANAAKYNIDPDRIAAAGDSAGGQLVALLGTTADRPELEGDEGNPGVSSRVVAVCDFFGPADFADWNKGNPKPQAFEDANDPIAKLIGGKIADNLDKARAASPITYVDAKSCPFYILHGDADVVVPIAQSMMLNAALKKAGVPSDLYIVHGEGHEFTSPAAFDHAFAFLKHHLLGN